MSTWLITGCSTGLGRTLAEVVLADGHNVVVTARDAATVRDLADKYPQTALALDLDVTDKTRIAVVAEAARERFGGIDVLVNNAGYGYRAAVEEGEDEQVERLFATNFHGAASMIKAVLPGMRARRAGSIVNISSIGARIKPAGGGYYAATKAALEGLSGALRKEVAPLGIDVLVVEPGAFRTDFAGRSLHQSAEPIADYAATAGVRRKENDTMDGNQPGDPVKLARAVIDALAADPTPAILVLGTDAVPAFAGVLDEERADLEAWRQVGTAQDL